MQAKKFFQNYGSILWMIGSIIVGSVLGIVFGEKTIIIKPIGDIFLNLLFTALIPLIFFTVSSSFANMDRGQKFGRLMIAMFLIFILTALTAAICTVIGVSLFPVGEIQTNSSFINNFATPSKTWQQEIVDIFTVNDVASLFSKDHILALMLFAALVGFASSHTGAYGKRFSTFLQAGNEVFTKLLMYVMKLAPVGIGAYFANEIGSMGTALIGSYARALGIYHGIGLFYYFIIFSLYALIAGGKRAMNLYWKNNITPSLTALGTCSSIATIPANLDASRKMKIPGYIRNVAIPLGGTIHKDGSSISCMIKIVAVFALFHKPFAGFDVITTALLISVAVSFVEGGIPSGGYIGELLVLSLYHFPAEAFPVVIILGTLVDPFATVLNVSGVTASAMLTSRVVEGKKWMNKE